jgi:hypothetical protein
MSSEPWILEWYMVEKEHNQRQVVEDGHPIKMVYQLALHDFSRPFFSKADMSPDLAAFVVV